jgi:excisionase family DNA binding protein
MAVIAEAGWPAAAMAPMVGLTPSAVTWRIRSARRAGLPPAGVAVPRARQPVPPWIDEKRWLRPGEAAALLGVHRTTLHRWRRDGLLPHAVVTAGGGEWRYCRDDLAAVLRRRGGRRILPPGQRHSALGEARVFDVPHQLATTRRSAAGR